jgi:hypothetical protein
MGAVAAHGEDGKVSQQGADHQLKDLDAGALFVLKSKGKTHQRRAASCNILRLPSSFCMQFPFSVYRIFLSFYSLPSSFSPLFLYPFVFLLIKSLLFLLL